MTNQNHNSGDQFLQIRQISKHFGDVKAVDSIDLDIHQGEFFCLLGGSGSGKSTLLRMIAGLEQPTSGSIFIDGQDVTHVQPWNRPVNMMFQSYALFPHMNVEKNVGYGLVQAGWPAERRKKTVSDLLDLVQLGDYGKRKPHQLSGGQRQRVALARALARGPKVLLLDEPLSALDKKLREETQRQLVRIQKDFGTTFIMVTHDQEEAMSIATRIAVMDHGKLVQVDSPREMYERPANRMIAGFIGNVNLFEGRVEGNGKSQKIKGVTTGGLLEPTNSANLTDGQTVWIAVRPERVLLKTKPKGRAAKAVNKANGTLSDVMYLGGVTNLTVLLADGSPIRIMISEHWDEDEAKLKIGDPVQISFEKRAAVLLES